MSNLVVYSSNGCAGCNAVINELVRRGVRHEVVKIDEEVEAMAWFKGQGHRTVPQVYTRDGTLLASSLMDLLKLPQGTLDIFK